MYYNCHTYYSFKYGTLSIDALFEEAKRCNVHKLCLTDINSTAAYIEMLRYCEEKKSEYLLEITVGIEFRQGDQLRYIALAQNNKGFENINRFLSYHNNSGKPIPEKAPRIEDTYIIYPFGTIAPELLLENEYIGIRSTQLTQLIRAEERKYPQKLVAWQPVTFANKKSFNIHKLLRAIDQNTLISKLECHLLAQPDEVMQPYEALKNTYQHYPTLLYNAEKLLSNCALEVTLGVPKNKKHFYESRATDLQILRAEAEAGFQQRYHHAMTDDALYQERFERELDIIEKKEFEAYYLISHDIIRYAQRKNCAHVGRGSGANSLIAYCLGITNVDPIELDLYFERFLNPQRSSPPDFDIDFSWKDRDTVTQYIFDKYGQDHVALLGTHTTYKGRSILRELGKVFGFSKEEIDKMVKFPAEYCNKDSVTQQLFRYAHEMLAMPNNLSIHAGGILITEQPIYCYTATDLPPKGFPVTHFEMHNAEDIGIYKLDILSQRGLGHIKDTATIVERNTGQKIDIDDFQTFKKDPKIKELLRKGNTMGCFYVESPAMRMLLGKLSCDDYITLVAASSIIRPGVAKSGMMRAYIERHHMVKNGKKYESIHPLMDELMSETYGVMVYQEDVIKVAHHFAQISLSEADVLRRGMSGKYRSRKEFQLLEEKFFTNCAKLGYPKHVSERVWFEIESFSGYSFSKGHSASYAVESYQSLYLKAHFPIEFMVGVINNFGGFYKTEFYFNEARVGGAQLYAPCINRSEFLTTISGTDIFVGFIHIIGMNTQLGQQIVQERMQGGTYKGLDNFVRRVNIGLEPLLLLIKVGAFSSIGKNKKELLWAAHLYFGVAKQKKHYALGLFDNEAEHYSLPSLYHDPQEDVFDQFEHLGFTLCNPFRLISNEYVKTHTQSAIQLRDVVGKTICILGYMVTIKNTVTKDGNFMHFGTFYDPNCHVFDTVHFPPVAKKYPLRGRGHYKITGKVVDDFGYPMVEVTHLEKIPMLSRVQSPPVFT